MSLATLLIALIPYAIPTAIFLAAWILDQADGMFAEIDRQDRAGMV